MLANAMVAWRIVAHNWRGIAIGAVILGLLLWGAAGHMNARHKDKLWQGEKAAHAATKLHVRVAAAQARADAEAAARKREARDAQIQQEKSREYEAALRDARVRLAAFVRRQSAQSHPGQANLSVSPEPTGAAPGPAGEAVLVELTDLDKCNTAVVKAEAWMDWWAAVNADRVSGGSRTAAPRPDEP